MRVLVTGITGFIGRHLAAELQAGGHQVWGASTDTEAELDGVELLQADITDPVDMARIIVEADPQAVIHLAGLSHVGESWQRPGDYMAVNFVGTRNLLRAAEGRRIIFASSSEVYGQVPEDEQPIREDRAVSPRSPYAMTKACAEIIGLERSAIVVRSFNSIGVGQGKHFALPSFATQLAAIGRGECEPVLRVGDLSPRRDFLHVSDAARAYRVLLEKGTPASVYNLGSGEAFSIEQALDKLRAISGVKATVQRDESRVRPVDIPLLQADNQRLRGLGWEPQHDLEQALRELWEEVRDAHPEATTETDDR